MKKRYLFPACFLSLLVFVAGFFLFSSPALKNATASLSDPIFSVWGLNLPTPKKQTVLIRSPYPYGGDCIHACYDIKTVETEFLRKFDFTLIDKENCNQVTRLVTIVRDSADAEQRAEFNDSFPMNKYVDMHRNTWFCEITDPDRPDSFLLILLADRGETGDVFFFHYLAP